MANKTFKKTIEIECASNEEKMRVGESIHNQLVGNPDYINSNILLNVDEDCKVILVIFNECQNEPEILILVKKRPRQIDGASFFSRKKPLLL